jgi:hypothetical protein
MTDVQILQLLLKLSCDSKKKRDNPLHVKGCAMVDVQILDKDWVAKSKPLFWLDKDWVVKIKHLFRLVQILIRIQTPIFACTDS